MWGQGRRVGADELACGGGPQRDGSRPSLGVPANNRAAGRWQVCRPTASVDGDGRDAVGLHANSGRSAAVDGPGVWRVPPWERRRRRRRPGPWASGAAVLRGNRYSVAPKSLGMSRICYSLGRVFGRAGFRAVVAVSGVVSQGAAVLVSRPIRAPLEKKIVVRGGLLDRGRRLARRCGDAVR